MLPVVLACCVAVLGATPEAQRASDEDLAIYGKAKAGIGRDAGAHVRLALWCEAHGLQAERARHLAMAVLIDPSQATARGLLGMVAYGGRWRQPGVVAEAVKADPPLAARLAEYNARRERAADTADAQERLALWCRDNGLEAEAQAHDWAVVRLDPSRAAAWKRLGCRKVNGRWVSEAQLEAEKAEAAAQRRANKEWQPSLEKRRGWLGSKAHRAEAERLLAGVTDPRAVPAVWSTFVAGEAPAHERAVQLLGQIDATPASRALAILSVFSGSPEARRRATEALRLRDPREFANLLIALMRKPVKYEIRPVGGPGSPGALFAEGRQVDVQRIYAPPPVPPAAWMLLAESTPNPFDGSPSIVTHGAYTTSTATSLGTRTFTLPQFDAFRPTDPALAKAVDDFRANAPSIWAHYLGRVSQSPQFMNESHGAHWGSPKVRVSEVLHTSTNYTTETRIPVGQMIDEYRRSAFVAQQQLMNDAARLDAYNRSVAETNAEVRKVLADVAGRDLGDDAESWKSWYVASMGYVYQPPRESPHSLYVEAVPLAYLPMSIPPTSWAVRGATTQTVTAGAMPVSTILDCFGAGTLVRTLAGSSPIEDLRAGDRVLAQDTRSGALGYRPVTIIHHNPPSPTFVVKFGGDAIVTSPFHRLWVVGKGWVMARDLAVGERVRMLDGPARIVAVESGREQLVYNIDVADAHDFFAGAAAALVHDNTLPDLRRTPFDAAPSLARLATPKR